MSQSSSIGFVVSFTYPEQSLTDLAKLTGQMTLAGFSTMLSDSNGVPHELGTNSFSLTTPLNQEDVKQLAQGLGEVALGAKPEVEIVTGSDYFKRLHPDT
ncbi:type V toxin-antitoxin system endoribonuclease antitoxin GhoS [Serratia fonticola]|uniref:type V toxin-antitoxin system endoribonuclease antitoxin GhoS n=1 Tax=Serratia fonticola TaxID=47917 RepID=UPI0027FDB1FD|nr:type V toxin-antitoxin system endoribonuclease antitoxin GhoS [Serratia fonticola]MDQ7207498.1 type V toxin-antitoxin system endoribonuclease antitoxin GhoS [Serratia fonticola]HBE9077732.1 type V toxin-antitoxin system endoribonuclease antitoxin GhoS [Serratia fonticola]HBE9088303.1 type V toxin-antitoxin system endoribonuclease antitoxin GhoS [Serratia fonticola]HBE9150461.1 type V toxin-antitoxin system endoribonuclease antitoxin GhoS [Serratia fonticola]